MSGPKSSRYYLTPEARRKLEAETDCLRRTEFLREGCKALYESCEKKLMEIREEGCRDWRREHDLSKTCGMLHGKVRGLEEELSDGCEDAGIWQERYKQLDAALHSLCAFEKRISTWREEHGGNSSGADLSKQDFSDLGHSRAREESKEKEAFLASLRDAKAEAPQGFSNRVDTLMDAVAKTIDPRMVEHLREVEGEALFRDLRFYREHREEFELLLCEYGWLGRELGFQSKTFSYDPAGLEALISAVEEGRKRQADLEEQRYIRACVDEAMEELGYARVGDRWIHRKSGKRYYNAIYSLHEGTAVSVTADESGQIAMEFGGLDRVDRMPDAAEAEAIVQGMEDFCGDYRKFVANLRSRGIASEIISELPVDAQYAQIINLEDYADTEDVPTLSVKKRKSEKEQPYGAKMS